VVSSRSQLTVSPIGINRSTSIARRASKRTSAIFAKRSTSERASPSASSAASRSGATLSA